MRETVGCQEQVCLTNSSEYHGKLHTKQQAVEDQKRDKHGRIQPPSSFGHVHMLRHLPCPCPGCPVCLAQCRLCPVSGGSGACLMVLLSAGLSCLVGLASLVVHLSSGPGVSGVGLVAWV